MEEAGRCSGSVGPVESSSASQESCLVSEVVNGHKTDPAMPWVWRAGPQRALSVWWWMQNSSPTGVWCLTNPKRQTSARLSAPHLKRQGKHWVFLGCVICFLSNSFSWLAFESFFFSNSVLPFSFFALELPGVFATFCQKKKKNWGCSNGVIK